MAFAVLPLLGLEPVQPGRLPNAELRALDGHDDLRPHDRSDAARAEVSRAETGHPSLDRRTMPGSWLNTWLYGLSDREAHLDAFLDHLQHRLDVMDAGRFLCRDRCGGLETLGVPHGGGRHKFDRDVLHVA